MRRALALLTFAALSFTAAAQSDSDSLLAGFKTPPASARPRTWWHWTNGNVTETGITKDLEWMKRVGIGGFQLADVATGSGQTISNKVLFGSPGWLELVRHSAAEADRLGLEMAIFSSPGWSETGGPWVKPEQAMKKIVWSETKIDGPKTFNAQLPQPPENNGPIRNLVPGTPRPGSSPPRDPTFYGDSAVIAFRTPTDESIMVDSHPRVTTSAGAVEATALWDD